jgi:uncharacterized RDD family membrane protein YckC
MISTLPTLSIRTPEGLSFNILLAGIISRFLAWTIDLLAVLALASFLNKVISLLKFLPALHAFIVPLLYFACWIGYGIFFEWFWRGQTPGKRLFRLRVMDVQGLRLQFSQVVIRNLLRAVDALPAFYLLGGTVCSLNRKCQRLGDIAANTIVARTAEIAHPEVEALLGNKFNSLRDYSHLQMRLRQTVTPAEAALLLEALRRARSIEPAARIQLFDDLAAYFKKVVEFPPEASEMISPEQYVRNVLDTIYSPLKRDR